jgi:hypothetical protein
MKKMKRCPRCKRMLSDKKFGIRYNRKSLNAYCKECQKERSKEYNLKNKEKNKQRCRIYYLQNKEKMNQLGKEWYQKNKTKCDQQAKKYRDENREKIREIHRNYIEKNKDFWREYHRNYRKKNIKKLKKLDDEWRKKYPERVKETNGRSKAKHRKLGFIPLLRNPFPDSVSVVYHHIHKNEDGVVLPFVIPIPKITHFFVGGTAFNNSHWNHNREWAEKIYGFDINDLLFDGFSMEDKNETS